MIFGTSGSFSEAGGRLRFRLRRICAATRPDGDEERSARNGLSQRAYECLHGFFSGNLLHWFLSDADGVGGDGGDDSGDDDGDDGSDDGSNDDGGTQMRYTHTWCGIAFLYFSGWHGL